MRLFLLKRWHFGPWSKWPDSIEHTNRFQVPGEE
jgi:hypothetical protein